MFPKCHLGNIPKRYVIVLMVFVGYANMFYLHSNQGMAVVEMTTMRNITLENGTVQQKADFNWSPHQKGTVLGSLSYGRLLSPIGGILSGKLGGSTTYSVGILITALVTFFSPIFLRLNFYLFICTNTILGISETFLYASFTQIFSRWAPPNERAKFISISLVGVYLGSAMSFIVSGWILTTWNWEVIFYASGAASFAWCLIWSLVVRNDPSKDKRMSESERDYIKEQINCNYESEKMVYPWKQILTCMPFWVACLVKFAIGSIHTFTFVYLPQYIKDTNDINIKKIGFISTIPQICAIASTLISGYLCDYLRSRKILSITKIHKIFISFGLFGCAAALLFVVLRSDFIAKMIAVSIMQACSTFSITSVLVLFLDLTPKYASLLNSIANVFFTSSGIITPILVAFIVTSHSSQQWNICFLTLSSISAIFGLLYLVFGSGKLRSWANYSPARVANQSKNDEM